MEHGFDVSHDHNWFPPKSGHHSNQRAGKIRALQKWTINRPAQQSSNGIWSIIHTTHDFQWFQCFRNIGSYKQLYSCINLGLMFVLHGAYSGSKAAPFVSRTKLWLGSVYSSIHGYWLRILYVAKHRICHDFLLPFNEVNNVCELGSPVVSFLQLTGTVSPFISKFVGKFFNDAQHVGRHIHIPKILHILHGIAAGSEEEAVVLQDLYVFCFNWRP
ncbi:uncharacterized protein LOC119021623 isoform X2 [Acanthopagrus latus]|uniref:uncharacterized protein LOC119021623 isoform X2 n=1 Tax=Acanthopagrus latus TaxID=8177 RepID=UPI00187CBB79|nr:uncharacterized protein LOC119021623 isoform X2 [Acanthopagrus latus]XP_036957926.1 uncharacterized protein LOC119021623 isoform X2 [Acanthopagrus latus]